VSRRDLLGIGAALLAILGLLAALGWGVYSSLTPAQQDVVRAATGEQAVLLAGSALLFAGVVGAGVAAFAVRHTAPARRLASDAEVVASVNPEHRIAQDGGAATMRAAAAAVEGLAQRYRDVRRDIDETVRRARADVEEERNRLAALMAELTQPVLVCNGDGRILLYNDAARELLGAGGDGAYVGLGRSLFGVVDRDLVLHALAYVRELAERGEDRPGARFATEVAGRPVRANVSPVRDAEGASTGFLLVLEDVTEEAESSDRRDAVLADLVDATQRAIASIRAAAEAVHDFGDVDAEQRERLLRIVRDEAAGLSRRVAGARHEAADLVAQRWRLEDMRAHDLLAFVRRIAERAGDLRLRVDEPATDLWVRADGFALARAVATLVRRLAADRGVEEIAVALDRSGRNAALDLRWRGRPLDADTLAAWEDEPLVSEGRRLPFTLREVLDRHGGEGWSQRDPDSGEGLIRLLLTIASGPERPAGPGPGRARVEPGRRPEFYDFDLFGHGEPAAALEGRRLDTLSYTLLDTETTGLDPTEDELIAIGAVRIVNRRLLAQEVFDTLIDPGRRVSPESVRIHGITRAMLEGQPPIGEVLPRFARFAEDTVLVGHNVAFDLRFFAEKEAQTGVRLTQPVLDTLLLSPVVHPEEQDHSLEAIAARLGVSVIGRHTALGDALVTAEIFLGLLRLLPGRGIETLGQALDASRRTYQARVSNSLYARR
jgi:DNA polymerase-3 subunit epsilon